MYCGQFTPIAGPGENNPFPRVHFFQKDDPWIRIAGRRRRIPGGIGVREGGCIGVHNDTIVHNPATGVWKPGQALAGDSLYYSYVLWPDNKMVMGFSPLGHCEDREFGTEVCLADPRASLVGMVYTDPNGKFIGGAQEQLTLSWFKRCDLGLGASFTPTPQAPTPFSVSDPAFAEISSTKRLRFLVWGINSSFLQGAVAPNIKARLNVKNNVVGRHVHIQMCLDGIPWGDIDGFFQNATHDCGSVSAEIIGIGGMNEGMHWASVLMRAPLSDGSWPNGGTAVVNTGVIYTEGLQS